MYEGIKKVKRSKGYFLDAVQAVEDEEKSKYFPKGLNLIGTYLDSDFLTVSQVLSEPSINVVLADDVGITLEVTLKPESKEDPILDIFSLMLEATDTGMFMETESKTDVELEQNRQLRELSTMMQVPRGASGVNEDPEVTLFFGEDSIYLQRFKLLNENYYLFSLTERAMLDEEEYEHTLNIMFKDKGSSFETFFSPLVGEKLDKRVTKRVLEGITQKNITGFFIGGATIVSKGFGVNTFAVSSSRANYNEEEELLEIDTMDTKYRIYLDALEHSTVEVNKAGKYTIILKLTNSTDLYIYMG